MRIEFIFGFWILITIHTRLLSQATYDNNWILGYVTGENNPEAYFGGVQIDFSNNSFSPEYFETKCFSNGAAVISDQNGHLLAYSDGCRIYNRDHQVMIGGDTIAYGVIWEIYHDYGYPSTQGLLFLPWPGDHSKYIMFYVILDDTIQNGYLFYSIIQFDEYYPEGHVISKDNLLLDSGVRTLVTAVKHANGRDWWVVLPEDGSNRMLKILLTDKGPIVEDPQAIGHAWNPNENASQAAFSPDGTRYVRFNGWKGLDIFDFDRGTGQFYNPIESGPFSDPVVVGGGVAVSPDSRYLYVTNIWKLFQYDLMAEDILGSRILIDTFDGYNDPFPTTFYQMALAPDEKIYMFSSNGKKSLHVIDKPKEKGIACQFRQHSIPLPAHIFFESNNIPYFRLGPDDGSVCDTLGLNNVPVAYFHYEVNGENNHVFSLTNLSYFNPEEFHWDFGDGQMSSVEDPEAIQYLDDGIYTICLQVSNAFGSDEYCQTITVGDGVVSTEQIEPDLATVYPNPFTNTLIIQRSDDAQEYQFDLFDLLGRNAGHFILIQGIQELPLRGLPAGLYMYTISNKAHQTVQSGRVVKVE